MIILRNYQQQAINNFIEFIKENNSKNSLIVMPTGAGKSIVLAAMIREYLVLYPNKNILVVTHRKELIEQDYQKTVNLLKTYDINFEVDKLLGLYGASLKKKQIKQVTFLQIQSSVGKNLQNFNNIDLIIVDEAHLIAPKNNNKTTYQKLLQQLTAQNENLKIVGLTATPYRLQGTKSKHLIQMDNNVFDNILYEISVNTLIDQGYLSKYIVKNFTQREIKKQLKKIHKVAGEFKVDELNLIMSADDVLNFIAPILKQIFENKERHHVLGFCVCVEHAKKCCQIFKQFGLNVDYLSGEMSLIEREEKLNNFKEGKINILLNVEILTTGYDAPYIDCILIMRPTKSLALHQQMIGRGFRIDESKKNTLYLDFSGNIESFKFSNNNEYFLQCPHCHSCYFKEIDECSHCQYKFFQNCPNCGERNSSNEKKCWNCDASLTKICPKCKLTNLITEEFCINPNCRFNFYKKCPHCNLQQSYDEIFCSQCNHIFLKKCPHCNLYTDNDKDICQHCGYDFYEICPTCNKTKLEINEFCECGERFKKCKNCEKNILYTSIICPHCKETQQIDYSKDKQCPDCNKIVPKHTVYCSCGYNFIQLKMPFMDICEYSKEKENILRNNNSKLKQILQKIEEKTKETNTNIAYVLAINCSKRYSQNGNLMLTLCYHCLDNKRYMSNINLAIPKADYFSQNWLKLRFPQQVTTIMQKLNDLRNLQHDNNFAASVIIEDLFKEMENNEINRPELIKIKKSGDFLQIEEIPDYICKDNYFIAEN